VNLEEWEQQLRQRVAEIHHHGEQLATHTAVIRGRGEVSGILIEVDGSGDITNLQIAPGVMRWSSKQLAAALRDCHRKALAEVTAKINLAVRKADPRIRAQFEQAGTAESASSPRREPVTEGEIQDADDEYFERRNLYGGWTERL